MPLKKLPFEKVSDLLKHHLSTKEDAKTAALIRELQPARKRGYLTRQELEKVCRWKSARAIHLIKRNTEPQVQTATRLAIATRSERRRLEALRSLDGVSVPMASAILMLLYPRRYGVIDIRVWQLLYALGEVTKTSSGAGFNFKNWYAVPNETSVLCQEATRWCSRHREELIFGASGKSDRYVVPSTPPSFVARQK